ncbi:small acid-soluble spore protein SspJ [Bacillus velezensis]
MTTPVQLLKDDPLQEAVQKKKNNR